MTDVHPLRELANLASVQLVHVGTGLAATSVNADDSLGTPPLFGTTDSNIDAQTFYVDTDTNIIKNSASGLAAWVPKGGYTSGTRIMEKHAGTKFTLKKNADNTYQICVATDTNWVWTIASQDDWTAITLVDATTSDATAWNMWVV